MQKKKKKRKKKTNQQSIINVQLDGRFSARKEKKTIPDSITRYFEDYAPEQLVQSLFVFSRMTMEIGHLAICHRPWTVFFG